MNLFFTQNYLDFKTFQNIRTDHYFREYTFQICRGPSISARAFQLPQVSPHLIYELGMLARAYALYLINSSCKNPLTGFLQYPWSSISPPKVTCLTEIASFRLIAQQMVLGHLCPCQICHPLALPIPQHAKGLTTVVVRMQHLMLHCHRSHPSCKSKAPY